MADYNRYITVKDCITQVLQGMGLPVPSTVVGNTDYATVQMLQLLNDIGQELAACHDWQAFYRSHDFATVPLQLSYDVPSDLEFYINKTGWNRTARIPLIGPMTDQQWALLQARQLGSTTLYLQFIQQGDKVVFYFVPDTPNNISITYRGRGWLRDASVSTTYRDTVANDSDIVLFDPVLIKMALKLRWRETKGFDVTGLAQDYTYLLDGVKTKDKMNPDLSLSRQRGYPYLGIYNLPDTGYGQST